MATMIEATNLSKRYVRPVAMQARYNTIRETITDGVRQLINRQKGPGKKHESFWALKDVSLSVDEGEIVGIIGKNGAGKSTLLKILSRITAPTSGNARLFGRVGSLLEVGTGFHPELSGRENIYMNGAILGMSRTEIAREFDEIVAFSGVEAFIDMPIKRYSSGMTTRLAFSVAAHLEPEILIIDEVLAVGDAAFQKKCMGKIQHIAGGGRTILFVSHNMNAIRNLCTRCVYLQDGRVAQDSKSVESVVACYLKRDVGALSSSWRNDGTFLQDEKITPWSFGLLTADGHALQRPIAADEEISVEISFDLKERMQNLAVGYCVYNAHDNILFISYSTDSASFDNAALEAGRNRIVSTLPKNLFNDGEYQVQLVIGEHDIRPILSRDSSPISVSFTVSGHKDRSSFWVGVRPTLVAPVMEWRIANGER